KLHSWARQDRGRRFDDIYSLVHDPATLQVAWDRVRQNRGARTAGVDGRPVRSIEQDDTTAEFLGQLRADLKAGAFVPLAVRARLIPKTGGKVRRLGIPTVRDRVVQAAQAGAGTRLRGALSALFVRVPTQSASSRRHR